MSNVPALCLAALDCFRGQATAVLVGGHDRGVDWVAFAEAMQLDPPSVVVTMGENGPRIHDLLAPIAATGKFHLHAARTLDEAMGTARGLLPENGVLLLSPGAPSFGPYRDYVARGKHFAEMAGFDRSGSRVRGNAGATPAAPARAAAASG